MAFLECANAKGRLKPNTVVNRAFLSPLADAGESFPPFFVCFCELSDVVPIVLEPDAPDAEPCIRRLHPGAALSSAVASCSTTAAASTSTTGATSGALPIGAAGQTQHQRRNEQSLGRSSHDSLRYLQSEELRTGAPPP